MASRSSRQQKRRLYFDFAVVVAISLLLSVAFYVVVKLRHRPRLNVAELRLVGRWVQAHALDGNPQTWNYDPDHDCQCGGGFVGRWSIRDGSLHIRCWRAAPSSLVSLRNRLISSAEIYKFVFDEEEGTVTLLDPQSGEPVQTMIRPPNWKQNQSTGNKSEISSGTN